MRRIIKEPTKTRSPKIDIKTKIRFLFNRKLIILFILESIHTSKAHFLSFIYLLYVKLDYIYSVESLLKILTLDLLNMSTEYYDNGQVKYEIWHDKDGSKKSSHSYFANGQRKEVRHFKTGAITSWYENGNRKIEYTLLNNMLQGKWKHFYENGMLAQEGSFKDGIRIGNWTHLALEDKNLKSDKKYGSLRYWKFIVNAAVRYGEILDKKNNGTIKLQFSGKYFKSEKKSNGTHEHFDGTITINNKKFANTRYIFVRKQLITFYHLSKNKNAYKNKLGGLVDYLMFSGNNIDKKRMASFYHECYKKNNIITAAELIEKDLADIAFHQWKKKERILTASIRNEMITEIRNEVLSDFEQTNTSDTREVVDEIKSKIENVEIEKKLQKEEKYKVEESGKDSVKIVVSDILISVDSIQYNGYQEGIGNSCTRLTFESGIHKYMKLSTWDQSGEVTEKAKTLIDKNVTTTCWDPLGTTKWSDMGYFKNIYEV